MSFTLQTIQDLASSDAAYARGQDYYKKHAISSYEYEDIRYGEWAVEASVRGSGGRRYEVSLHFEQDELYYMDCNCMAFARFDRACKHIVCTLIRYFHEQVKEIGPGEDEYARRLMDIYITRNQNNIIHVGPKARVYPKLHISENREVEIYLSLSVGIERRYVVKDILKFARDVLESNEVVYGKNLTLVHQIEAFDSTSQKIIQFLIKELQKGKYGYRDYYTRPHYGVNAERELELTEGRFQEFFQIMEGETVEFQRTISDSKGQLLLKEGNPPIEFKLSKEESGFALEVNPTNYELADMHEEKYVILEDALYHCTSDFAKDKYPLLMIMREKIYREEENELFFTNIEMKEFCSNVLPKIESGLIKDIEEGDLEEYIPKPLRIKLYLDSEDREIIARADFCYGEVIIRSEEENEFPMITNGIVRNVAKESDFVYELLKSKFYKEGDCWRLSKEEDVYEFLTGGIEGFFEICQVNVTESLKSFKIISSPIASMGIKIKNDLLNVNLETLGMSLEEVMAVLGAYKERKKYYRLNDGSFVNIEEAGVQELSHIIDGLDLTDDEKDKGQVTLPKYRALYLDNVAKSNKQIKVERDKGFKQIVRDIKNVEDADYEVPEALSKTLRNYQKTGYRWLKTMASYEFGGILADDMGLGKTLQIIALICDKKQEGQSIVICPTSVVLNWKNEFEKFAPHISATAIQGNAETRKQLIGESGQADVLLTSYELLKRDIDEYEEHRFCYIVADEAQYIKNHNTQNSKALKSLQGKYKFALTGTPIENSLAELWSIFDFVMPGYLFGYTKFKKQFETPIVKNRDTNIAQRLQKFVAPFIMRRLKKDVLTELPEKIETVIYSEMITEQKKIYNAHLAKAKMDFTNEVEANGFAKSQIKILSILTRLRQICCHPGLFLEDYNGASGKLDLCLELIEDSSQSGHRILLFSQFTTMLDKISEELDSKGIEHLMLTGSTQTPRRMQLVDEFNEGQVPVFLISLKAGGTGLNLTAADIVIHYDPWWNLSAQNQATDRAYRMGQKNNVQVFQLITKDSIEEKIQKLQERKKDLTESVIKEGETFISKMSEDEVLSLFERI